MSTTLPDYIGEGIQFCEDRIITPFDKQMATKGDEAILMSMPKDFGYAVIAMFRGA